MERQLIKFLQRYRFGFPRSQIGPLAWDIRINSK
jgi:hypothetical protein